MNNKIYRNLQKIFLFLSTVRYLKAIQIKYQVLYRLKKHSRIKPSNKYQLIKSHNLIWKNHIYIKSSYLGENNFIFLNKIKIFSENIDWNFKEYGKLWTYNLSYFDFLNQKNITKESGTKLINLFIEGYDNLIDGKEPYPTSLRIMNWVKFLSNHNIDESEINTYLSKDINRLGCNLEYHLLANHLLENAFALLFGASYFSNEKLYFEASSLIAEQIEEQILPDGAHYELSPMYHQIVLYRILDCIQVLKLTDIKDIELLSLLELTASKMISWLRCVTFKNGDIPLVNDSAKNICTTSTELFKYSENLQIPLYETILEESGYRKVVFDKYELFLDIGDIKPAYQPGHAHADTFNYVIYSKNKPFIIEAGTSTYEHNERRLYERSTKAHNTVVIKERNSSQVWSSFRVGRRAKVFDINSNEGEISASHDGYGQTIHTRKWQYEKNMISITDELNNNSGVAISYIHFHPSLLIELKGDNEIVSDLGKLTFIGHRSIEINTYGYSEEFNINEEGKVVEIKFDTRLNTTIIFTDN